MSPTRSLGISIANIKSREPDGMFKWRSLWFEEVKNGWKVEMIDKNHEIHQWVYTDPDKFRVEVLELLAMAEPLKGGEKE